MSITSVSLYKSVIQPTPTVVSENSGSGVNKNTKGEEQQDIEKPASGDTYSPGRANKNDTYTNTGKITSSENVESQNQPDESKNASDTEDKQSKTPENALKKDFSSEETKEIQELKSRDIEVKAHEQAHVAAGGQYVNGGAEFQYKTGPDGKRYATGGEVSIDISKVPDNPEATIKKMQVVRSSALAPANPSQQDRSVASQATRIEMEARAETLQVESVEKKETASKEEEPNGSTSTQYDSTGAYTDKGNSLDILI